MIRKTTTAGYSLVEVLIAITILLLAIAGPLTIAAKGLQSSYFARDQLTAFMLAQEGIESIITIRNNWVIAEIKGSSPFDLSYANLWNWTNQTGAGSIENCFVSNNPNGCNISVVDGDPSDNFTACGAGGSGCLLNYDSTNNRARYIVGGSGNATPFTRVITLDEVTANREVVITSAVTWQPTVFGGSTKTVVLTTSILNLYGN